MNHPKLRLILPAAPYANGPLHAGRVGGSLLPADIFNRFCKLMKIPTYFGVVSDCHGTPIMVAAQRKGITYTEFTNFWHNRIGQTLKKWNIQVDYLHSTQQLQHKEFVQKRLKQLNDKGHLKYCSTKEFYCETCKKIPVDRYIQGYCICGSTVKGYECENCNTVLNFETIKQPICSACKTDLKLIDSENYLLNLEYFKDQILVKYEFSNFYEQILNYYNSTQPKTRPILRHIEWGIPNNLPKGSGVIYVWIEALYSYLSFTDVQRSNNYTTHHFIGKDNSHFHTVIYNHLLAYHGYPLMDELNVRNWFLFKGLKQSSSKQNYIDLYELIDSNDSLKTDYFRAYVSYNDTLNRDSNLSLQQYNKFCEQFNSVFHNLFYRVYSYYRKKNLEFQFKIFSVELCEQYINLQQCSKLLQVWQHIYSHAKQYNEVFQKTRDLMNTLEHKAFIIKLIILLYELKPFMPTYSVKWLKTFELDNGILKFDQIPFRVIPENFFLNL